MTDLPCSPTIHVDRLRFAFHDAEVLSGIDLTVSPGRIHALVGVNGAGKTTLMRAILGMLRPSGGFARLGDHPATAAPSTTWARIGYLLGTAALYPELTARQSIYSAARLHGLSRVSADQATDDVVTDFALGPESGKRVRTLSLGNRQRVALAAVFAHRPRLLVLDEPTLGLDPLAVLTLRRMLRKAVDDQQTGVLVSSHHLDEVARVADEVSVIHRGRIIAAIDPHGIDLERQFFNLVYAAETKEAS